MSRTKKTERLYARCVTIATMLFPGKSQLDFHESWQKALILKEKTLNRLTERVFTNALTDSDRGSRSDLVQESLCGAPDADDDNGKLAMNNDNNNEYS